MSHINYHWTGSRWKSDEDTRSQKVEKNSVEDEHDNVHFLEMLLFEYVSVEWEGKKISKKKSEKSLFKVLKKKKKKKIMKYYREKKYFVTHELFP